MNCYRKKIASPTVLFLMILLIAGQFISARAQSCIQPPQDLVSWWKGDGDALDVRSKNNGTILGNTAFVEGFNGRAFNLAGFPEAVGLGNNPSSLQMTSMTIEAWINKNGLPEPGALEDIFAKWFGDATQDSFLLAVYNDNGALRAFGAIGDGVTGDGGFAGGTINLSTWTHVAMTYNASDGSNKLYINGAEVASRIRTGGIFAGNTFVYLGREYPNLERYYKGLIDEPAVYSRALSGTEIQTIYNAGQAGKCKPAGLFSQKQRIGESLMETNALFGNAIAIDGSTFVVGSPNENAINGAQQGGIRIYFLDDGVWTWRSQFMTGFGAGDNFGHSVAISGNTMVVGSPKSDWIAPNAGNAMVFVRSGDTWFYQYGLAASDAAPDDEFGESVAIQGDTIVVGAPRDDQPGNVTNTGAIYIFNRNGVSWTQTQKFTATGTQAANAELGESVAIDGDTIVAGAPPEKEDNLGSLGKIYIYERSGGVWSLKQKIRGNAVYGGANLGISVAIDGNTIVTGAHGNFAFGNVPGTAFVFVKNGETWSEQKWIVPSDFASYTFFGMSVAIKDDTIAIGAPYVDSSGGLDAGATYIYKRSGITWTETQKINPNDGYFDDHFGTSVALDRNKTLVVGAPAKDNIPANNDNKGVVYTFNLPQKSPFDFDGDGKTDISIYRPSNGQWWIYKSSNGGNAAFTFGNSTDKLAPADFTGDGRADVALFRPASGEWFILRSENETYYSFPFGTVTDIPAPADFDADGRTDAAVFRPSSATWSSSLATGGTIIQQFGISTDVPTPADYDGDGKADIAIYRPSNGQWWIQRSTAGIIAYTFGNGTDKTVQGDYTGDDKADVALYRPSTGEWLILRSEDASYYSFPFGTSADIPAPGDYDGDGKFDAAVFRPSAATWYVNRSTAGILIQGFGLGGDVPVPNAFVR